MKGKLLLLILLLGAFIRFYKLPDLMPFIGDQGWYYISARDLLLTGEIPLVGITSSHIWLHQGAIWTYILALIFKLSNFNPVVPSYFVAILGTVTILIFYKLAKDLFSKKIALVSSLLYATSPLVVADSRMAYHTSLIPFFTIILIMAVFRFVNGKPSYFPFIIFLLAVLYNLEISTFTLAISVAAVLIFGLLNKRKWATGILNIKIFFYSAALFFVSMLPMIIYDLSHGYPQTVKFIVWVFYRIAVLLGYPPLNPNSPGETWQTFFPFLIEQVRKIIFFPSKELSMVLLLLGFGYLSYRVYMDYKKKKTKFSQGILLWFGVIPLFGYIAAKTNSSAYLSILYPQIFIIMAFLWDKIFYAGKVKIGVALLIIASLTNAYFLIKSNFFVRISFIQRVEAARNIITLSKNKDYNIIGQGEGSQYESFTTTHEYLTWWLGHGPSQNKEKIEFYISEGTDKINIDMMK